MANRKLEASLLAWIGEMIQYGLNVDDRATKIKALLPKECPRGVPRDIDDVCDGKLFCALAYSVNPTAFKSVRPAVRGRLAQFQGFCRDQGLSDTELICPPDVWPLPAKYPGIISECLESLAKQLAGQRSTCSLPRLEGLQGMSIEEKEEEQRTPAISRIKLRQSGRPMNADLAMMGLANAAATLHVVDKHGVRIREIGLAPSSLEEDEEARRCTMMPGAEGEESTASVAARKHNLDAVEQASRQAKVAESEPDHAAQASALAAIDRPKLVAPTPATHESPDIRAPAAREGLASADAAPDKGVSFNPKEESSSDDDPQKRPSTRISESLDAFLDEEPGTETSLFNPTPPRRRVTVAEGFELYEHVRDEDEDDDSDTFDHDALPILRGKLWKKSPARWRLTSYDQRYFIVRDMHIFWWESKEHASRPESRGADGGPLVKGNVNLVMDACQIECDKSDRNKFYLRPIGKWAQGKYTQGRQSREFAFDCSGSDHPRATWLKVIHEHIEYGERMRSQVWLFPDIRSHIELR